MARIVMLGNLQRPDLPQQICATALIDNNSATPASLQPLERSSMHDQRSIPAKPRSKDVFAAEQRYVLLPRGQTTGPRMPGHKIDRSPKIVAGENDEGGHAITLFGDEFEDGEIIVEL